MQCHEALNTGISSTTFLYDPALDGTSTQLIVFSDVYTENAAFVPATCTIQSISLKKYINGCSTQSYSGDVTMAGAPDYAMSAVHDSKGYTESVCVTVDVNVVGSALIKTF